MGQSTRNVVVFDLGGVLARICHTWEEAADVAGVPHDLSPAGPTALGGFSGFDLYQAGKISFPVYLKELALFIGCSDEDSPKVHNSIIVEEYPGIRELVRDLRAAGFSLGCLSNTNDAHWGHLALNGRFPVIESLDMKMASHIVGLNKPDPFIYRAYAAEFGLHPEQIVFFDDHPANVQAAVSEGWLAAHIVPGEDTARQMRRYLREWGLLPGR
ncbi:MAG: HAD family hydrolase [Fimbriimonas sp.]